jgi:monovalent cation/hydrogen antiporter
MNFFESLLLLMLVAIILLQVARWLSVPYPSMLAMAGVLIALVPGTPSFTFDPHIALALFIAPALMDAAFDFPFHIARRFWLPLVVFAIGGVIVTTAVVAYRGGHRARRDRGATGCGGIDRHPLLDGHSPLHRYGPAGREPVQ